LRRFAQGTGRKETIVSVATPAIDHFYLQVAAQAVMLEAVIANDHIASGGGQRKCGGGAVAIHAHLRPGTPRDQHRFVAAVGRRGAALHPCSGGFVAPSIAATGYARSPTFILQPLHQCDGQRRFAGAADREVADHHHRHRDLAATQEAGAK